ncbi:hypothetical protein [Clostridium tyrobutyricum]|uniref:hypothetical protein n=1 Tax=Clostridium tyrobutyricum TaxID=1519 RepID=UPI000AED09C7|nr:hypothetical protein [Clostridium tyrobutyricum]
MIEHPEIDGKIRKKLRNKIIKQLPFGLSKDEHIKREMLSKFKVFNIEEWHLNYPKFVITEIS